MKKKFIKFSVDSSDIYDFMFITVLIFLSVYTEATDI